jgi:hypothetical protein
MSERRSSMLLHNSNNNLPEDTMSERRSSMLLHKANHHLPQDTMSEPEDHNVNIQPDDLHLTWNTFIKIYLNWWKLRYSVINAMRG